MGFDGKPLLESTRHSTRMLDLPHGVSRREMGQSLNRRAPFLRIEIPISEAVACPLWSN